MTLSSDVNPGVVVIGASAGGIGALITIMSALPADFPAPIVIVQHRAPRSESLLVKILARRCALPVLEARAGEAVRPGAVYVARPDQHLTVTADRQFAYSDGRRIRHVLSSANPLFNSSADVYGPGTIAVILSGAGHDGTDGVQAVKAGGGTVIAQDEETATHFGMPGSAIDSGAVDYVLPIDAIAPALVRLTRARTAPA